MIDTIKIGQRLDIEEIIRPEWLIRFGEPAVVLSFLNECGISFVEFTISEKTDPEHVLNIAKICGNEGVFVAFQTDYRSELLPQVFQKGTEEKYEKLLYLASKVADITESPVPIVFNWGGYIKSANLQSLDEAGFNAKAFFKWVVDITSKKLSNVIPLCGSQELKFKNKNISFQIDNCDQMFQDCDVEICWDFGKTWFYQYKNGKNVPDEHYVSRIGHVHAYDIYRSESGFESNKPLGDGLIPWKEYCAILARHCYSDTILLDINPMVFKDLYDLLFYTRDGVEKLALYFR